MSAPIIAYDARCGLCHGFVRLLLRHDRHGRLRFAGSTSVRGAAIFAEAGLDPADPAAMVTLIDGRHHMGADGAIAALVALGGGWRLVALLRLVPAAVRRAGYRWIAANRLRWFGAASGCPTPRPDWAARFLP